MNTSFDSAYGRWNRRKRRSDIISLQLRSITGTLVKSLTSVVTLSLQKPLNLCVFVSGLKARRRWRLVLSTFSTAKVVRTKWNEKESDWNG